MSPREPKRDQGSPREPIGTHWSSLEPKGAVESPGVPSEGQGSPVKPREAQGCPGEPKLPKKITYLKFPDTIMMTEVERLKQTLKMVRKFTVNS